MRLTIKLLLLVTGFQAWAQVEPNGAIEYTFRLDSIYSTHLQDHRTVKIYLPEAYSTEERYPVIYTLDGEWMFEPVVAESKVLMDFSVIPRSIVVGIFHQKRNNDIGVDWNTGELTESSLDFYMFLTQELLPAIDENYATSGFNALIGHSNSATYCHEVMTQNKQPFRGFVALSQNLFGNQMQEYIAFSSQPPEKPVYYFVASGRRDATPRLESGMVLDSLFRSTHNPGLRSRHVLYDADHSGVAAKGLNHGISFLFSDYKHYNDWDDKLIDSLSANNVSPIDFIKDHANAMKTIYGIEFDVNQDDLSLMQALTKTDEDIKTIQDFEIEHFGKNDHFYATYAQYYEYAKSYENALAYWVKNLEGDYEHNQHFFYYRRPIELLYKKMNKPEGAIGFAQKWKKEKPELSQPFNYWVAKVALESGTDRQAGLKAIREYLENYTEDSPVDMQKAREMEQMLKK